MSTFGYFEGLELEVPNMGNNDIWKTYLVTEKQRHHCSDKGLYSQSYGFSISHVQMWELDHKEGRASMEEFMLLNYRAGEDSWESLVQQGDQTSQS